MKTLGILASVFIAFSAIGVALIAGENQKTLEYQVRFQNDQISSLSSYVNSQILGASGAEVPTSVALFESSLASQITTSATAMTLVSATDKAGTALASSTYAFVLDEGTAKEEMVIADCTATACTNMIRGLSPITGTTTVTALRKDHRRGASVKITDGPQLMILSRIANGLGEFPNLLKYKSGTACTGGSSNSQICDKAYIDGVAVAGASNANETTKGIVELATKLEMASSTSLGSTAASLVLQSQYATTTPYSRNNWIVISKSDGTIDPLFISTSTSAYGWGALHTFNGGFIVNASSTFTQQVIFSTPAFFFATTGLSAFTSTSTGTSTMQGNLTIAKNASTTGMVISGRCVGCMNGWEKITNSAAGPATNNTSAAVSATCSTGKVVLSCGAQNSVSSAALDLNMVYPDTNSSCSVTYNTEGAGNAGANTMTAIAICAYP